MNNSGWIAIGLGALALIVGGYMYSQDRSRSESEEWVEQVIGKPAQPTPEPKIRYPVPEVSSGSVAAPAVADAQTGPAAVVPTPEPLPALEDSDAPLLAEAEPLFGKSGIPDFLVPEALIGHLVVTLDNLDRHPIRLKYRPVEHVPGQPAVNRTGGAKAVHYLTAANAQRYAPYVSVLEKLDPPQVAALYRRYYPLFQEAYTSLGYPNAYFNDRLIAVIDHLLETPVVNYPIPVVQPKVFYEFADPDLEERSWGQKTLIRLGPEQMATVKSFLRELRAVLVAG